MCLSNISSSTALRACLVPTLENVPEPGFNARRSNAWGQMQLPGLAPQARVATKLPLSALADLEPNIMLI
jgi:hypothetical protein